MTSPLFIGLNRWAALSKQINRSFNGRSSLPIYEIDQATVKKRGARIDHHRKSSGNLDFDAWRLAHAIVKADCARRPPNEIQWIATTGFCLEYAFLFNWDAKKLCLNKDMANYYADFSSSSLAGRIAQGMALLFLEDEGYSYVGHFKTEWEKRAATQNKSGPKSKRTSPDFIVENKKKERVLAESKGSFSRQPKIKEALKKGLCQLDGWDKHIMPQPIKSFAIGTFFRECQDCSAGKTSSIYFVDPEPESPQDPVEFPDDAIRHANYASWLSLMGFNDAAVRLRTGSTGEVQSHRIPILRFGENEYAVSVMPVTPIFLDGLTSEFGYDLPDWLFGSHAHEISIAVVGIDLEVLDTIGASLSSPKLLDTMEWEPQYLDVAASLDWGGGEFYGSIYSDGSLFGELRSEHLIDPRKHFEWREVKL